MSPSADKSVVKASVDVIMMNVSNIAGRYRIVGRIDYIIKIVEDSREGMGAYQV